MSWWYPSALQWKVFELPCDLMWCFRLTLCRGKYFSVTPLRLQGWSLLYFLPNILHVLWLLTFFFFVLVIYSFMQKLPGRQRSINLPLRRQQFVGRPKVYPKSVKNKYKQNWTQAGVTVFWNKPKACSAAAGWRCVQRGCSSWEAAVAAVEPGPGEENNHDRWPPVLGHKSVC